MNFRQAQEIIRFVHAFNKSIFVLVKTFLVIHDRFRSTFSDAEKYCGKKKTFKNMFFSLKLLVNLAQLNLNLNSFYQNKKSRDAISLGLKKLIAVIKFVHFTTDTHKDFAVHFLTQKNTAAKKKLLKTCFFH